MWRAKLPLNQKSWLRHGQKWRTETEKKIFVDKFSDSNTVEHTGIAHFAQKFPSLSTQSSYTHDCHPIRVLRPPITTGPI